MSVRRQALGRRIGRWTLRLAAGLVGLAVIAAAATWFLLQASLPKLEGTVEVAGLTAPVEIARDRFAIPHIRAERLLDAAFAQGFVHAQDRLFQLEFQRRTGAGRLAELIGERGVPIDRFLRTLGLYHSAEASVAALAPETRAWLEAYARGVNAFLARTSAWQLPPELLLLRHAAIEPWRPADSVVVIKLMALTLDTNLWGEVQRAQLEQRLPRAEVAQLWPADPPGSPITLAGRIPAQSARPGGSNVWSVDGSRSASGAPLLANDPHLGLQSPGTFYLARLEAGARRLVGATLPGVPGIVIGHNGRIAWGFTTPGIDTQDLFIERPDPERPRHYLAPGGARPFTLRHETIEVRGGDPVSLEVRSTRHGPVISSVRPDIAALAPEGVVALAWTALADDDTTIEALHRTNLARNRRDLVEGLRKVVAPGQNVAFADRQGIGFFTPGRVPIRRAGRGVRPVPGWDGRHDWVGWIPFEQLPHALEPGDSVFINANNRLVGNEYPYFLTSYWPAAYRARRIEQRVAARRSHDLDSFAAIQNDVVSLLARELLPALDAARFEDPEDDQMRVRLRRFDGTMAADAAEPLLFAAWYRRLSAAVLGPVANDFGRGRPRVVVEAVAGRSGPGASGLGVSGPVVAHALTAARADLVRDFGDDPAAWRWGQAHRATMPHPLLQHVPVIGPWFGIEVPTGGDGATVNVGHFAMAPGAPFASTHAASFRGLYDLADLERARFVTPTGQSGHPLSPHRADLTARWAAGETVEINAATIDDPKARAGTLWLRPRGSTAPPG